MDYLKLLKEMRFCSRQIVHVEHQIFPGAGLESTPVYNSESRLGKWLQAEYPAGIFQHQARALESVFSGNDTLLWAPAASGKSLCFHLPAVQSLLQSGSSSLLIFPTKALAWDQAQKINSLLKKIGSLCRAEVFDGDTPSSKRQQLRANAGIILTNADMLHHSILPYYARWGSFWQKLKYVVIDELHVYQGIYGSQCAWLFFRLKRILEKYNNRAQWMALAATHHNPQKHCRELFGSDFKLIKGDRTSQLQNTIVFWDSASGSKGNSNEDVRRMIIEFLDRGIPTLTFAKSWTAAELLAYYIRKSRPQYDSGLSVFRGGYLPGERQNTQHSILTGKTKAIITVLGLDLGIDFSGIEVCIVDGFPGSVSELRQQSGRVGRSSGNSLTVLVGHDTPTNQYLMRHPGYLLSKKPESVQIWRKNPYIAFQQIQCAAREIPLSDGALKKNFPESLPVSGLLLSENLLWKKDGLFYAYARNGGNPSDRVKLRGKGEIDVKAVDISTGKIIAYCDEFDSYSIFHPGAIYFSGQTTYLCRTLDLKEHKQAGLEPVLSDFYTYPFAGQAVHSVETVERLQSTKGGNLGFGEVIVRFGINSFLKVELWTREFLERVPVELPPIDYPSMAIFMEPEEKWIEEIQKAGRDPLAMKKGLENAMATVVQMMSDCGPGNLGMGGGTFDGLIRFSPWTAYVFDNYRGGLGYTERCSQKSKQFLEMVYELIKQCPCEEGCPSCVGSKNAPMVSFDPSVLEGILPDKASALAVSGAFLGKKMEIPSIKPHLQSWRGRSRAKRNKENSLHLTPDKIAEKCGNN